MERAEAEGAAGGRMESQRAAGSSGRQVRAPGATPEAIRLGLERNAWRVVDCQFTDVAGALKSVLLPATQLRETLRFGHWFDGSALEGSARAMETDLLLSPDLSTWGELPWPGPEGERAARVLCDVLTPDGQPFPADPRGALRRVVQEAASAGLRYSVSPAVDVYLFRTVRGVTAGPLDRRGAFDPADGAGSGDGVGDEIVRALEPLGVPAAGAYHGAGPGQYVVDLPLLPAVAAADAVVACKFAVRAVARRRGIQATFMPRPAATTPGSALLLRQSLAGEAGEDALSDAAGEWELSPAGRAFVAGQLAHAPGLCAVLAPTVNSYKRLGWEPGAGGRQTWSREDAGGALRLGRRRRAPARAPLTVELRLADPACNPYLALAVALAAGLDGLRRELPLPAPAIAAPARNAAEVLALPDAGSDPLLPASLGEAIAALERDAVLREALGAPIYERLVLAKSQEWQAYRRQVGPWEVARYFETA